MTRLYKSRHLGTIRKALTTLTANERYMTPEEASLFNAALAALTELEQQAALGGCVEGAE